MRLPALDALVEADRDLQQLLVAERSLIFSEPGTELFEKFVKDYEENLQQSDDRWQRYRKLAATAEDQPTVTGYEQVRREWLALSRQVIVDRRANTPEGSAAAIAMTLGQAREKFDAMREFLNTAQERNLAVAGEQYKQAVATYNRVRMLMMLLGAASVLIGVGLSLLVGKTLSRQIRELALGLRSGAGQVVSAADELSSTAQVLIPGRERAGRHARRIVGFDGRDVVDDGVEPADTLAPERGEGRVRGLIPRAGSGVGASTSTSSAPADARQPAVKPHRWVDVQVGTVDARYRLVESSAGVRTASQMQQRETLKAGVKFDKGGRYSLKMGAGSGSNFAGSWDNSGPGTGAADLHLYMRQLYVAVAPIKGIEIQIGGIAPVRGESTEITSYDNDGFLVGERISVKRRKQTQLDEIAVTVGHLGDLNTPNVFRRFDGLAHHNFAQVLTSRKFGSRASASADWTSAGPEDTFHEAIRLGVKESRVVDGVRLEFYERVTGVTGKGFAASIDRALTRTFTMSGGYATVDRAAVLNGDRFVRGRRGFVEGRYALTPEVTLSTFFTRAFRNDFAIPNGTRLDVVVTYNILKGLQRGGVW